MDNERKGFHWFCFDITLIGRLERKRQKLLRRAAKLVEKARVLTNEIEQIRKDL